MNYRHLRYFWTIARNGSVAAAAAQLHLTPQTLSGQVKLFEEELGAQLFRKSGRRLELTEDGRTALGYADSIFALGSELESALFRHDASGRVTPFRVGVTYGVPRSVALRLLLPALRTTMRVRLECHAGDLVALTASLALQRLELVVAEDPAPRAAGPRVFNHALGRSPVGLFAAPSLLTAPRRRFPQVMNDLPLLLPGRDSRLHAELVAWLAARALTPRIAGVFDDTALMKAFAQRGAGAFPAPLALAQDIEARYGVRRIGTLDGVHEQFFAISAERRVRHPCVTAVTEAAREAPLG